MNGMPSAASCSACSSIASRPSGAMIAIRNESPRGSAVSCAHCIAPGWNAVIWLLSRSVMMKACAVYASATVRTYAVVAPHERRRCDVVVAVDADRRDDHRLAAERRQVVGDVAGAAAELAAQRRHQERDVQQVHLVGQDLVGEAPAEIRDAVEGERSTDEG